MRLTKELEKRIKESLDKKYQEEFANLYMLSESLQNQAEEIIAEEVLSAMKNSPILHSFIINQMYREEKALKDRIKFAAFNYRREDYVLDCYEELQVVQANISALNAKKQREMEDLKIMISYSKDLKDIRKLFEDSELEF